MDWGKKVKKCEEKTADTICKSKELLTVGEYKRSINFIIYLKANELSMRDSYDLLMEVNYCIRLSG